LKGKKRHKLGNLFAVKSIFMMGNSTFPANAQRKTLTTRKKYLSYFYAPNNVNIRDDIHKKLPENNLALLCGVLWLHGGTFLCAWSRREMENRFLNIFLSLLEEGRAFFNPQFKGFVEERANIFTHPENASILIALIHSRFVQLRRSLRNLPENLSGKDTEMMNHNCREFPINYPSNFLSLC
jgi:hypothetical protein